MSIITKKEPEHNVTTAVPFNFVGNQTKIKNEGNKHLHTVYRLINSAKDSQSDSQMRTISVKIVLKTLHNLYYEKAANIKDSKVIESQSLAEFLYDSFVHKYGMGKLAEKKVTEILTTIKAKRNMPKLKIFGRFLYLFDYKRYSMDDLKFFFYINRQMVAYEVIEARPYYKKDTNFEAKTYNASLIIDTIKPIFEEYLSEEFIQKSINEFKEFSANHAENESQDLDSPKYDIEILPESVQEWFIDIYNDIKVKIVGKFHQDALIPEIILKEYSQLSEEVELEFFILKSLVTQSEASKILKFYSVDIDSSLESEFYEVQKEANPLEVLYELKSLPDDSERKYKLESVAAYSFYNKLVLI